MVSSGIIVPMVTPTISGRSEVDEAAAKQFTKFLVKGGVDGLFPGSSIGEFPSLSSEQNQKMAATVVNESTEEVDVLAGCCGTSVEDVVANIDAMSTIGADAAVVVCPYYLATTQDGLYRFFIEVADQSALPILMYNIPFLAGNSIEVKTVQRLSDHENIVGLKDTSGEIAYHYHTIESTEDSFTVFQGATDLAIPSLDMGASGLIAGPANVFPSISAELYDLYREDNYPAARNIMQTSILPVVATINEMPTASALKYLISKDGLDVGDPLAPLPMLTEDERGKLDKIYQHVKDNMGRSALSS